MEEFEIYCFDDIFYTKEEIEDMGLSLFGYTDFKRFLDEQADSLYQVTTHTSVSESTLDLGTYLSKFDQEREVFARVIPGHGIMVIDFKCYYGIKHDDQVLLFSSKIERDDTYRKINNSVEQEIAKVLQENWYVQENSTSFKVQETQRNSRIKLRSIFTEADGKKN